MNFIPISLKGAFIIETNPKTDYRGEFYREFCQEEFEKIGHTKPIIQINRSLSFCKNTLRGLHFQYPPYAEIKIVSCIQGAVQDIMVDLRKDSDTFLNYFSVVLHSNDGTLLYVPEGFAHGFLTLTDNVIVEYLTTEFYTIEFEEGIRWDDPKLKINWFHVESKEKIISEKDQNHPLISDDFKGIEL